ncbi:MAG: GNAT family N-acetyltransferase [Treponema sp.]|jgi:N-acetylglutamate synthase-like GNAT family acetyltransferase|nr:GNAT family N-acetyltransferase [Treponema sp.]
MQIESEKTIYRKLNPEDLNIFVTLRLDFLNELQKFTDEKKRELIIDSLKKYFSKHIDNNEFIGIICEYGGCVISTAYLIINEWPANGTFVNGKVGTLLNVYTYPEYRKNGISTNIIKMIIEEARKQNVSIIDLLATESGEKVYKKLGFMETEDKSMRLKL